MRVLAKTQFHFTEMETLNFVTAASNLHSAACYIEHKMGWEAEGAPSRVLSFTHC